MDSNTRQEIHASVNAVIEELQFLLSPEMAEDYEDKGTDGDTIFSEVVARVFEVMRDRNIDYRTRLLLGVLRFTGRNPETKERLDDLIQMALDFRD